jgi:hypothetical protein
MAETHDIEKTGFIISGSACQRHFGFLSQRPKGTAIPEECLTCTRMLDCMVSKLQAETVTLETEPELEVVEKVEKTIIVEEPKIITEQVEKKVEPSLKQQAHKDVEPAKPAEEPTAKKSDDDFCVESPGALYNQWSGTVLISKETLELWGKKVKEVEVQTHKGKKTTCKVYAVPDLPPRVIQIPSKIKADLEIDNGSYVRVKPAKATSAKLISSLKRTIREGVNTASSRVKAPFTLNVFSDCTRQSITKWSKSRRFLRISRKISRHLVPNRFSIRPSLVFIGNSFKTSLKEANSTLLVFARVPSQLKKYVIKHDTSSQNRSR